MAIRVLIADRQDMFRELLRCLLESQEDFTAVGDTDDGEQLLELAAKHRPDVILMDIELRKYSAIEMLRQIAALKIQALENQPKPKPELLAGDFKGQKTVFLLWNPQCGFCLKMLDDVKAWESSAPKDAPSLVFVSTGTVEETQAQGFRSTVLHGVGANGTPSAVMTDEEGKIVSGVAVGGKEVLTLMGVHA
jgi:CheY-like chemotaxis protein